MPSSQLHRQLELELGPGWRDLFFEFNEVPIAAASIGQVHRAVLNNPERTVVALKIQYPGVADSIESDLNNLKTLITMANVLPRGLFLENIIKVAGRELSEECKHTHTNWIASIPINIDWNMSCLTV